MGLETGTYIDDLVATNPVGASDLKSKGDDHIRLIKSTILATFPNITGAMTKTHAELNDAPELSSANAFTDVNTFSAQLELNASGAGAATAPLLIDANAPYMRISEADQAVDDSDWMLGVSSGVLHICPVADADATPNSAEGIHLTRGSSQDITEIQLDADLLDINGAVDLSSTLTVAGVTTIGGQFRHVNTGPQSVYFDTNAAADNGKWQLNFASELFRLQLLNDAESVAADALRVLRTDQTIDEIELNATLIDINGAVDVSGNVNASKGLFGGGSAAAPGFGFASETNTGFYRPAVEEISLTLDGGAVTHWTKTTIDFKSLNVSTANDDAREVGFKGMPQNSQAGDYTLVLADAGRHIYKGSGGGGETITIPANASVAFPIGTVISIVNAGGGDLDLDITTDTMVWSEGATTGNRTIGHRGVVTLIKVASTTWYLTGSSIS